MTGRARRYQLFFGPFALATKEFRLRTENLVPTQEKNEGIRRTE